MKPNNAYSRACAEREVPLSVIEKVYFMIKDKPPEEQDRIRTEWAKIIENAYPYREGREPGPDDVARDAT